MFHKCLNFQKNAVIIVINKHLKPVISFQDLLNIDPANPTPDDYKMAEKFVCRMYQDPLCNTTDRIRVRTLLSSNKPEENPPTSNALHYHICRAFCQASRLLYSFKGDHTSLPSPIESNGFYMNESNELCPVMMTLEPMSDAIEDNITCNCKTDCTKRYCKCKSRGVVCTQLCHKKLKYSQENCRNLLHNREEEEDNDDNV